MKKTTKAIPLDGEKYEGYPGEINHNRASIEFWRPRLEALAEYIRGNSDHLYNDASEAEQNLNELKIK